MDEGKEFLLGIHLFFEEPRCPSIGKGKQFVKIDFSKPDVYHANISRMHLIRCRANQYYSAIQAEQLLHGTLGPNGLHALKKHRTSDGMKPNIVEVSVDEDQVSKLFINLVTNEVKLPSGDSVLSSLAVHMGKITKYINSFSDKELFNIDKERGVVCLHLGYTNIVGNAWITTPRGKSPGFLPRT
jgi:hypothetical protein